MAMILINRCPYILMFLSGFAGLGYEMVWVRALSAGLGHEIISVLAVVAAFFVGTAAGAWLLERPVRLSAHPGRWYAALEAVIALWAVVLSTLIPRVATLGAMLMGVTPSPPLQWGVTFLLPLILLLPATMAMGATLPAMDRMAARMRPHPHMVGGLYGANTFGAVAGTLAATFWLVPALGFGFTQWVLAVVNLVCASSALAWSLGKYLQPPCPATETGALPDLRRRLIVLFFTGLLGIGYEVVTVRIVSQILENTVFSYTVLLAVYLSGTAAGAAFYQFCLVGKNFRQLLNQLLILQALACTSGMWLLTCGSGIYTLAGHVSLRAAEVALAAAAFGGPTFIMGALFSHLAQGVRHARPGLGRALSVNTIGGAVAPFLFGIVLLPRLGPAAAMFVICVGYLLLLTELPRTAIWPAAGVLTAAGLIFTMNSPFNYQRLAPGETVVAHQHGIMAAVTVIRDSQGAFHLKVNNHYQMGGTASRYSDQRQAHIPLLLHPAPRKVLFLGLGPGTTFNTASLYPRLRVDGVELIPEAVPLMSYFRDPTMTSGFKPDLHIFTADARRFVLAGTDRYDVIVADLFHPSRDGAGFLYTKEHFSAVRDRLSKNGIFCQWLPLYQMDLDLLRLITRTFLSVFPEATAFIAHHSLTQPIVGLIGGPGMLQLSPDKLKQRMTAPPELSARLRLVGLSGIYTLLGCYLADSDQLIQFAGSGPLNTDDQPRVIFQAPELLYAADVSSNAAGRLNTLVAAFTPQADKLLSPDASDADRERLTAYWQARNVYLHTGTTVIPTASLEKMVAQVAQPLLDIVRTSPDFEAAYHPLLIMALRLARRHPEKAAQLMAALEAAAPQRPEAGQLRLKLSKGH